MTFDKEMLKFKKDQRVTWRQFPNSAPWPSTVEHVSLDYVEIKVDTPRGQGDVFCLAMPHELEIIE